MITAAGVSTIRYPPGNDGDRETRWSPDGPPGLHVRRVRWYLQQDGHGPAGGRQDPKSGGELSLQSGLCTQLCPGVLQRGVPRPMEGKPGVLSAPVPVQRRASGHLQEVRAPLLCLCRRAVTFLFIFLFITYFALTLVLIHRGQSYRSYKQVTCPSEGCLVSSLACECLSRIV